MNAGKPLPSGRVGELAEILAELALSEDNEGSRTPFLPSARCDAMDNVGVSAPSAARSPPPPQAQSHPKRFR
jgi:hypothetical protein